MAPASAPRPRGAPQPARAPRAHARRGRRSRRAAARSSSRRTAPRRPPARDKRGDCGPPAPRARRGERHRPDASAPAASAAGITSSGARSPASSAASAAGTLLARFNRLTLRPCRTSFRRNRSSLAAALQDAAARATCFRPILPAAAGPAILRASPGRVIPPPRPPRPPQATDCTPHATDWSKPDCSRPA